MKCLIQLLAVFGSVFLMSGRASAREPESPEKRAQTAIKGFMRTVPERLGDGRYRTYFTGDILPKPAMSHAQWDFGDCSSRALSAWHDLREITGDRSTGREVEEGQLALLLSVIHPETGLVYVPDLSDAVAGKYYYHAWDQGRAMLALAGIWLHRPEKRAELAPILDRMVEGFAKLATIEGTDSRWGQYKCWPSMAFVNTQAVNDGDWGSMRASLTIQGLVLYGEASGNRRPLDLARKFAAGVLSGNDGDSTPKGQGRRLGPDGSISAHLHSGTATLIGTASLGRYFISHGERDLGRRMLLEAKRSYDWLLAADNPCRGSRIGWIPEHRRPGFIRLYGEICCTSDTMELAALLAQSAALDPEFAGWERIYDEVAAMLVNTVALSQFRPTDPTYRELRRKANSQTADGTLPQRSSTGQPPSDSSAARLLPLTEDVTARYDGAWLACFFPNDFILPRKSADGNNEDWCFIWGCCMYAGVHGLATGWRNAMTFKDGALDVNYFVTKRLPEAAMTSRVPKAGKVDVALVKPAETRIRIPGWLKANQLTIKVNGKTVRPKTQGLYLSIGKRPAGSLVSISFPLLERRMREYIGGDTNCAAHVSFPECFCPDNARAAYEAVWIGDYVVRMDRAGKWPVFPQ